MENCRIEYEALALEFLEGKNKLVWKQTPGAKTEFI
jgi:hypothetical protein